jgi:Zn-dependent oligopeptidase
MNGLRMNEINDNPLLQRCDTPLGISPFDRFTIKHFKPAIEEAIKSASDEIDAITGNEMQSVAQEVSPLLARFSIDITMNNNLFRKVKSIFDLREGAGLNCEQMMLLEKN